MGLYKPRREGVTVNKEGPFSGREDQAEMPCRKRVQVVWLLAWIAALATGAIAPAKDDPCQVGCAIDLARPGCRSAALEGAPVPVWIYPTPWVSKPCIRTKVVARMMIIGSS